MHYVDVGEEQKRLADDDQGEGMAFDNPSSAAAANDDHGGNQLLDYRTGTMTTNDGYDDRISMRTESVAPELEDIEAYNREKGEMHQ